MDAPEDAALWTMISRRSLHRFRKLPKVMCWSRTRFLVSILHRKAGWRISAATLLLPKLVKLCGLAVSVQLLSLVTPNFPLVIRLWEACAGRAMRCFRAGNWNRYAREDC